MPKLLSNDIEFTKWADLIPESLLLLDVHGRLLGVNRKAVRSGLVATSAVGSPLSDLTSNPDEKLREYLKQCCRSRGGVIGSLSFNQKETRVRCEGSLLSPANGDKPAKLLLRVLNSDQSVGQFTLLNEKLNSLAQEIERRQLAEANLRDQHALAALGDRVGIILVHKNSVSEMLQSCSQAIVDYLDVASASIWLTQEDGKTLSLAANAGIELREKQTCLTFGQSRIGMIATEQLPFSTHCIDEEKDLHLRDWAQKEQLTAFAGFPMTVDGLTEGVITVFAPNEFTERLLQSLSIVANSIALGISRKQVEDKLRQYADELVYADQRKDEFLAMLAHELRNPLAPLRSGLELLNLDQGEHAETLGLMKDQVQHMTRLVDDLLDISRIMRNKIELRRQTVELNASVRAAFKGIQRAHAERVGDLNFRDHDSPIWVNVDPVRLSQILMNLLNNAVKYTPEGGSVWLDFEQNGDQATVTVRDSGIGIEPSFLSRVFDLFSQADRSLDRSQGGLGIGLTLTRRLVELHGGKVRVSSEGLNMGSVFSISLPVTDTPNQEELTTVNSNSTDQSYRILVVDDIVGSARILKKLLVAIGQKDVETAHDGLSAVETARKFEPDIILLDIGLPKLNGYEVAAELRSDPVFSKTMIVAVTGYGDADSRARATKAGFDQHLVKPVGLDDLNLLLSVKGSQFSS